MCERIEEGNKPEIKMYYDIQKSVIRKIERNQ